MAGREKTEVAERGETVTIIVSVSDEEMCRTQASVDSR